MERMPTVFFGHGNPMNALQDNAWSRGWADLGRRLPRPRAVLSVSAHWYQPGTAVTTAAAPRTIHDFGGFPRELFEVQYPAPGDPGMVDRVRELLAPLEVRADLEWGLDHGTWSVLRHVYPEADVPVVQLSLDAALTSRGHYELAQRLHPLLGEGVLIAGFGNVVHNLQRLDWNEAAAPAPWGEHFNRRVDDALRSRDHAALVDPVDDEATRLSVPTPEHYWPLLYALAQQGQDERAQMLIDGIEHASIGMLSVLFGAPQ